MLLRFLQMYFDWSCILPLVYPRAKPREYKAFVTKINFLSHKNKIRLSRFML